MERGLMSRYVEIITSDPDVCVHCGVYVNASDPQHAWSCPVLTDIWTVGPREISEDMCCMGCSRPFELGDFYTGREVHCLGCAASEAA